MLNGRKRIRLHFGTLTESSVEGGLEGVETLGWMDFATPKQKQERWREEETALRELEFDHSLNAVIQERENLSSIKILVSG